MVNKLNVLTLMMWSILIMPIVDMVTYLFKDSMGSVSQIYKMLVLVVLAIYLLKEYFLEDRKKILLIVLSIVIYMILFLVTNVEGDLVNEFESIFKLMYLPLITLCFYAVKRKFDDFFDFDIIVNVGTIYSLIIVVSAIVGVGNNSFATESRFGTVGMLNSANEIGVILGLAMACALIFFKRYNVWKIIIMLVATILIGTKTPLLAVVIVIFYAFAKYLRNTKQWVLPVVVIVVTIIGSSILFKHTPVYKNLIIYADHLIETEKYEADSYEELFTDPYVLVNEFIFSQRLELLQDVEESTDEYEHIIGIGYFPEERLIEMDYIDIFYRLGIIGFIFYIVIMGYIIDILNHFKKFSREKWFLLILVGIISFFVGHVLTAVSVAIIVSLVLNCEES